MPGLRRRLRFHGLKRPKVRQDMNKYNLFNLSRLVPPNSGNRTYFQQKWTAKAQTRGYHGEQIKEKQWQQMFSRVPNAVVPMNPEYLATNDGSAQAAGRGSGLEVPADSKDAPRPPKRIPYMQMVYAPSERRLDTAIFRALFASSARQARQFVTHGQVKVNGKKMLYPGYLLNPGDLFQVEPERVLYATGAFKNASGSSSALEPDNTPEDNTEASDAARVEADAAETATEDNSLSAESLEAEFAASADAEAEEQADPSEQSKRVRSTLNSMRTRALSLVSDNKKSLSGKRLQELRAFAKSIKSTISRASAATPSTIDDLETQLASLSLTIQGPASSSSPSSSTTSTSTSTSTTTIPEMQAAIEAATSNPFDASKPYATPWRPREWMSAFAFIPRYLEVNQKICAAVYLRHPAVMPGLAEVPTPFGPEVGQLAFNWYLRRR